MIGLVLVPASLKGLGRWHLLIYHTGSSVISMFDISLC